MPTSSGPRADPEEEIRSLFLAGDLEKAAILTLQRYGQELKSYLATQLRDADAAAEVFAQFGEELWRSLPGFQWKCSIRTWSYKLARRAAKRHQRREYRHKQQVPLTSPSRLAEYVAQARTGTAPYRRTELKDRFQALREQLPPDDQTLLVLRIDRGMSWLELAEVMAESDDEATPETRKREAARLRKRYQLAKERLRSMAEAAGLLPS